MSPPNVRYIVTNVIDVFHKLHVYFIHIKYIYTKITFYLYTPVFID